MVLKREYIAIRADEETKKQLSDLAEKECRTLSQQCLYILRHWLDEHLGEKPTDKYVPDKLLPMVTVSDHPLFQVVKSNTLI